MVSCATPSRRFATVKFALLQARWRRLCPLAALDKISVEIQR
jgi:hypothetical protein